MTKVICHFHDGIEVFSYHLGFQFLIYCNYVAVSTFYWEQIDNFRGTSCTQKLQPPRSLLSSKKGYTSGKQTASITTGLEVWGLWLPGSADVLKTSMVMEERSECVCGPPLLMKAISLRFLPLWYLVNHIAPMGSLDWAHFLSLPLLHAGRSLLDLYNRMQVLNPVGRPWPDSHWI